MIYEYTARHRYTGKVWRFRFPDYITAKHIAHLASIELAQRYGYGDVDVMDPFDVVVQGEYFDRTVPSEGRIDASCEIKMRLALGYKLRGE